MTDPQYYFAVDPATYPHLEGAPDPTPEFFWQDPAGYASGADAGEPATGTVTIRDERPTTGVPELDTAEGTGGAPKTPRGANGTDGKASKAKAPTPRRKPSAE